MVRHWKVLSFVVNRVQVLYKTVSEPLLHLIDVKEATSGSVDAVDHIDGCAGEHLSDVEGLFCALNRDEGRSHQQILIQMRSLILIQIWIQILMLCVTLLTALNLSNNVERILLEPISKESKICESLFPRIQI
eukprot:g21780.t1